MSTELIGSAVDAHDQISGLGIPTRFLNHQTARYIPHDGYRRITIAIRDIIDEPIEHISHDGIREARTTLVVDVANDTIVCVSPDVVRDM